MTLEEELKRAIEDRDQALDDIDYYDHELLVIEREGVTEENEDEYCSLDDYVNQLNNEVSYLNAVIEDLEYQIKEQN